MSKGETMNERVTKLCSEHWEVIRGGADCTVCQLTKELSDTREQVKILGEYADHAEECWFSESKPIEWPCNCGYHEMLETLKDLGRCQETDSKDQEITQLREQVRELQSTNDELLRNLGKVGTAAKDKIQSLEAQIKAKDEKIAELDQIAHELIIDDKRMAYKLQSLKDQLKDAREALHILDAVARWRIKSGCNDTCDSQLGDYECSCGQEALIEVLERKISTKETREATE